MAKKVYHDGAVSGARRAVDALLIVVLAALCLVWIYPVFLILINILLLIVGAVLEPTAAILILVPVLVPIAEIFGIDQTHFAVMVIFNLMIGLLTPPVGLVLFVLSSVTQIPVTRVIKGVLPFFIPMLVVLLLITFVPALSTWLPSFVG